MLKNLGYTKLEAVMDILGLDMETIQPPGLNNALARAARSVCTSCRDVLTPAMLSTMLRSGLDRRTAMVEAVDQQSDVDES